MTGLLRDLCYTFGASENLKSPMQAIMVLQRPLLCSSQVVLRPMSLHTTEVTSPSWVVLAHSWIILFPMQPYEEDDITSTSQVRKLRD